MSRSNGTIGDDEREKRAVEASMRKDFQRIEMNWGSKLAEVIPREQQGGGASTWSPIYLNQFARLSDLTRNDPQKGMSLIENAIAQRANELGDPTIQTEDIQLAIVALLQRTPELAHGDLEPSNAPIRVSRRGLSAKPVLPEKLNSTSIDSGVEIEIRGWTRRNGTVPGFAKEEQPRQPSAKPLGLLTHDMPTSGDDTQSLSTEAHVKKSLRGRPKKVTPLPTDANSSLSKEDEQLPAPEVLVGKHQRGRPKKNTSDKPSADQTSVPAPTGLRRGRPRKGATSAAKQAPTSASIRPVRETRKSINITATATPRKSVGRPRKSISIAKTAVQQKPFGRPRGRPSKRTRQEADLDGDGTADDSKLREMSDDELELYFTVKEAEVKALKAQLEIRRRNKRSRVH